MNKTSRSVIEIMTEIQQNPQSSFEYWIMIGSVFTHPTLQQEACES